jgi:hypothetical protein
LAANGKPFKSNDFATPIPGSSGQNSFKGTIKSIQGYTANVVDDKGKACTLYFGGGSLIQSVNKPVPQAGDNIFWIGNTKTGGSSNEYNVHHCTCY